MQLLPLLLALFTTPLPPTQDHAPDHAQDHSQDQAHAHFEISDALLADAIAQARPVVERVAGVKIPDGFTGARRTDVDELERLLARENLPIMLAQLGDEELARAQAQSFGASLAPALFAKYAFEEQAILVSPEAFELNADLLGMPELLSEDVVRAVIVHELVHAIDVPHFDFPGRCVELADAGRIQALGAVLEGHAQFIARKACAELGLQAGMETYDRAVIAEPLEEQGEGEALRLFLRMQRRAITQLYTEGEKFVAAVHAAEGPAGVARAFTESPADMAVIQEPKWFLDPASRPRVRFDLEAALDLFETAYADREDWARARQSLAGGDLANAFADLGDDVAQSIRAGLRGGRLLQLVAPGQEAVHYVLAAEWSTTVDARLVVEASEELLRRRDETMKEGTLRVVGSRYDALELPSGARGFYAVKNMKIGDVDMNVVTVSVHTGTLSFELLRSGQAGTKEEFLALTERVIAAARVPVPAPAPSKEEAEEAPDERETSGGAGG